MMASCLRPDRLARWCAPDERVEVLFEELAELAGQRNAIDGRIVEIVAELDRDELCGATGARSVAALVAWKTGLVIGERSYDRHRRAPAGGVSPLRAGHAGGPTVAGSGRGHRASGRPRDLMSTMRSWPRSPRSTSCAPRSSWNRDPTPNPIREPEPDRGLDHQDHRRAVHLLPDQTWRIWRRRSSTRRCSLISDALIAEWKRDHDKGDATRAPRSVSAAVAEHRRGVHASGRGRLGRRGGSPAPRAAHHRGRASRRRATRRCAASGSAALRGRSPIPDL